jgi:ribosomal protein S18 acetylase RimI-like enzyme
VNPTAVAPDRPPLPPVPEPVLPPSPPGVAYRARRPTRDDVDALLDLCRSDESAVVGSSDVTRLDVEEAFDQPHTPAATTQWVVEAVTGGATRPVAWAAFWDMPENPTVFVDVYRDRDHTEEIRAALIRAYLDPVAELAVARGGAVQVLGAGAFRQDEAYGATLRSLGFAVRRVFSTMRIDLAGTDPAPPAPPPGVTIRAFLPDEAQDWEDAHRVWDRAFRDHFEYQSITLDAWRQELATNPDPDYGRWLLAEVDVGGRPEVVGMLESNGTQRELGGGWVRTLGVLAGHRGRGIGRALLRHAFARYAADGLAWAGLGVDTANTTGALALYLSTGLRVHRQFDAYRLDVTPAGGRAAAATA